MSLFYFDEEMNEYERKLNFNPIIYMLENKFKKNKDSTTLATIIGCSWYNFIEGSVNQTPYNYDSDFLLNKWKEYVDIGINNFSNYADVCLITAYTLNLHWFYLGKEYEKIYPDLYKKSIEIGRDNNVGQLASYFLKHKLYTQIDNSKLICQDLFPTESILDKYFREILNLVMVP